MVIEDDHATTCVAAIKSHKILRACIPNELFYGFINKIATKTPNTNYYLIDVAAYKKSTYIDDDANANANANANTNANTNANANANNSVSLLQQFCTDLLPYYCNDKQVFVTRKMSYKNLNTILRQICRQNSIECKSQRKYDKSKTHIVYHIHDELNPQ
jgi:hypothetical protein